MVAALLGIDWGTSNRRAWLVGAGGVCLRRYADEEGALAARGRYAASLQALCRAMQVADGTPIVMSGAIGSAQGWQEVAYLDCSVPLERLPQSLVPLRDGPAACFLVPGYCQLAGGEADVMRGEETQLLGALALGHGDGWYVLPGTHSKWVLLGDGCVRHLVSYLTGELFALLRQGGTLAPLMMGGHSGQGLLAGALRATQKPVLTQALFAARARAVAGLADPQQTYSYVSGLLVGTEFAARPQMDKHCLQLLGAPELCATYASVGAALGFNCSWIDAAQAHCAALGRFLEQM
ncbi:2-dehydro-3-deoxygalactonokinase [Pseudoduganella violacea]|uniref:2-dehydro-3-deoxygalactonokinase n=1 Tax=Pseudoduganella violacea TaxID=1715466 RepID=A0A7W5BFX5_9BURK|nr:2-dehydro-3-deoxygalactonokinase [Pseudoduganella violacea]MBB3121545.1 2-dehydro-3-deoxygalactonokinase [Pseudoduganella violacea]